MTASGFIRCLDSSTDAKLFLRRHVQAAFVLVSHDTDQIARVCSRVLVLDAGRQRHLGDIGEGIRLYQEISRQHISTVPHEQVAEGTAASILLCDDTVGSGGTLQFKISIELPQPVANADVRVVLWGDDGLPASDSYTKTQGSSLRLVQGANVITCAVGPLVLKRGRYAISIALLNRSNNFHLYWGDRVRTIEVDGPATGAVAYTPALASLSVTAPASQRRVLDS